MKSRVVRAGRRSSAGERASPEWQLRGLQKALWAEEGLAKASGLVLAGSLKEQALGRDIYPAWHILSQQPAPNSIWECLSFGLIPCLLCLCVTESHKPGLAPLVSAVVRDQPLSFLSYS